MFNLSQIGELCRVVDDKYTKMHPEMIYELLAGDWHGIIANDLNKLILKL